MIAMFPSPRSTSIRDEIGDEVTETNGKKEKNQRGWLDQPAGSLGSMLIVALSLMVVFAFIRPHVAEVFDIPSSSMEPTLAAGDHVLVAKSAYSMGDPQRGDIAALRNPESATEDSVEGSAEGSGEVLIKRIVGLPGDKVEIRDGVLYVNGEREREAYVDHRLNDGNYFGPASVPAGSVFVMGDNRANSRDSRTFGPVDEQELQGKVLVRVWPLGRAGGI